MGTIVKYLLFFVLSLNLFFAITAVHAKDIQDIFKIENTYLLPADYNNTLNMAVNHFKGKTYFIYADFSRTGQNTISLINLTENIETKIHFPIDSLELNRIVMRKFAINDKYMILAAYKSLYVFQRDELDYTYEKSIQVDISNFDDVILSGKNLYLSASSVTSDFLFTDSVTIICKINLVNNIIDKHILPNPQGITFTLHQPRKLTTVCENNAIVSDAYNNRILVYDWKGNLRDSLFLNTDRWFNISEEDKKFIELMSSRDSVYNNYHFARNSIEKLRPFLKKISLIENVSFIDSDKLFVSWSCPENSRQTRYFNIYCFQQKKWLLDEAVTNYNFDTNEPINKNGNKWFITNKYTITDGMLIQFEALPFEIDSGFFEQTLQEIQMSLQEYYQDNDMRYNVINMKFTNSKVGSDE